MYQAKPLQQFFSSEVFLSGLLSLTATLSSAWVHMYLLLSVCSARVNFCVLILSQEAMGMSSYSF